MKLNTLGYEIGNNIFPIELINRTYSNMFNVFEEMAKSKYGIEQQKFWSPKKTDEINSVETLRINNADVILPKVDIQNFINLSGLAINRISKDKKTYTFSSCHSFYKAPIIGRETPWHQDPAYSSANKLYNNITCWIPLCDVNETNSCLQFLKSSHKNKKLLPHVPINKTDNSAIEAIFDHSKNDIATVSLSKGDSVFHRSYVVHRSTANNDITCRIALILIFTPINKYGIN